MAPAARTVLQVAQLSSAVEQAVKAASDRHRLQFEPEFTVNGLINGRVLREAAAADLGALRQASQEIAKQVEGGISAAGQLHLEPAVLLGPKYILCGFIGPAAQLIGLK